MIGVFELSLAMWGANVAPKFHVIFCVQPGCQLPFKNMCTLLPDVQEMAPAC